MSTACCGSPTRSGRGDPVGDPAEHSVEVPFEGMLTGRSRRSDPVEPEQPTRPPETTPTDQIPALGAMEKPEALDRSSRELPVAIAVVDVRHSGPLDALFEGTADADPRSDSRMRPGPDPGTQTFDTDPGRVGKTIEQSGGGGSTSVTEG